MFIAGAGNLRYGDIVAIDAAKGAGVEGRIVTEGLPRPPAATDVCQGANRSFSEGVSRSGLFLTAPS